MIDPKILKERRSRRVYQTSSKPSTQVSPLGSACATPIGPPFSNAANGSEKSTKIKMTWDELDASISIMEGTPDKRALRKTAWATPDSLVARRDRRPLSAASKESKSIRKIGAIDPFPIQSESQHGNTQDKNLSSLSYISGECSTFRKNEEGQNKFKIVTVSDDLSKSALATNTDGKRNNRTRDKDLLRAKRKSVLKDRSKTSLAGNESDATVSCTKNLQPVDDRSNSDSSLKARLQSGIIRGNTHQLSNEPNHHNPKMPTSEVSQYARSSKCDEKEGTNISNGVTPEAKDVIGDLDGESAGEQSSPLLITTQRSRDAAAKLAIARSRSRSISRSSESHSLDHAQPHRSLKYQESLIEAVDPTDENSDKHQILPDLNTPEELKKNSGSVSSLKSSERPKTGVSDSWSTDRAPLNQLPLSVQRERVRRREDRRSYSGKTSQSATRRNLDKRTARMRFSDDFRAEIQKMKVQSSQAKCTREHGSDADPHRREENGISVFVRKRPLFDYEERRNDFDVVEIGNAGDKDGDYDRVIVHNCSMHPDMKRKFVQLHSFPCSAAFDENCSDDDIFKMIAKPLVKLAANGNVATILMYGQTGSGKTHTMTGIEERTAETIFEEIDSASESTAARPHSRSGGVPNVCVRFVELCGKSCKDLLGQGDEVKLADEKDGSVRLVNSTAVVAESSRDLARLIAKGKCRRATEATDMNGVSSRSHAVCQIEINFTSNLKRGLLTLIDCAGSERRYDSMYHSSQRQKESAQINESLWKLKECIRARKNGEVVQYRSSLLTRILRESFERDGAKLSIIATVAPNASDTEHSCETLKTVATIVGSENLIIEGEKHEVSLQRKKSMDIVPPRAWDHAQLVAFFNRKKIDVKVHGKIDGRTVMRMNVQQIRARLCKGCHDENVPNLIFNMLRKENDRIDAIQRKGKLETKVRLKQEEWESTTLHR